MSPVRIGQLELRSAAPPAAPKEETGGLLRSDRVTVAIPAYNAAATLEQTLNSVRAQSYRDLEILIVDDGSSDGTALMAERHARADSRITVLRQPNGGVSRARNVALARATGALFAPIDADDLWHPEMIARQVQSMRRGGDAVVLSYTWFAHIDERGRILSTAEPGEEGNVLARMCHGHLIGNGSGAIMRTRVLREVGGWDPALRDGNEDYKTFFLMAERGEFVVVRAHLLGYRQTRGNRSGKALRMLATYDRVLGEFRPRYPQYDGAFAAGRGELIAYLFDKAVLNRHWRAAAWLAREAWRQSKPAARAMLWRSPLIAGRLLLPLPARAILQAGTARGRLKSRPFLAADGAGDRLAPECMAGAAPLAGLRRS